MFIVKVTLKSTYVKYILGDLDTFRQRVHNSGMKGQIIKMSAIPKRVRNVTPRAFKELDLWPEALKLMATDGIGVGDVYVLPVPEDVLEQFPDLVAVARPIKKFVQRHYSRKYEVRHRHTAKGAVILICHPAPKRKAT